MRLFVLAVALLLVGCATGLAWHGVPHVTPSQLAGAPAKWDGKVVEVTGLIAWEFENSGLWQDYESYCRHAQKAAVAVEWDEWPSVALADNRRHVVVRGRFRNVYWVSGAQPKRIAISTGAPGPGPLEPGVVVSWQSPPLPPCR